MTWILDISKIIRILFDNALSEHLLLTNGASALDLRQWLVLLKGDDQSKMDFRLKAVHSFIHWLR